METNMQLDEFMDRFLKFEEIHKMFRIKINHVNVWQYFRIAAYGDLLVALGLDSSVAVAHRTNVRDDGYALEFFWKRYVSCNQFLTQHRDVLIVSGDRKYKDGSRYYKDQHANMLDRHLLLSHYLLDVETAEGYKLQKSRNVLYCDIEAFRRLKGISCLGGTASKSEILEKIIAPMEACFEIKIAEGMRKRWIDIINEYIATRNLYINYYKYMLRRITPKIVLMVNGYATDRMFLCEVAHQMRIPVVELQHGLINNLHIAYNFYEGLHLKSFPDYVFTFGKYEKEVVKWPIQRSHVIPVGHPELENYCEACEKKENKKKMILFISQATEEIAKFAGAVAEKLSADRYRIVFQLHSHEYHNWKRTTGKYLRHPNIRVVGSYAHMPYEELPQADWVVGCASTMLSEAQMFEAKVAILKIDQYEVMEFLYKSGSAVLVESPEQLIREIEEDTFRPSRREDLFEKNGVENMRKAIDMIIAHEEKRVHKK